MNNLVHLDLQECDLDWVVREVATELSVVHNTEFKVVSQSSCLGNWNEDGLRRVIENLTTNAIKYGSKNTPVSISLIQDTDSATLSVHNYGVPISKEYLPILFDQFRRAKSIENQTGL